VLVVALLAGAATSFGQTHLPDQLGSLANSSGSWCALAYGLALVGRRPVEGVAYDVLSLVALVSGYYAMSHLRGFGVGFGPVLFWMLPRSRRDRCLASARSGCTTGGVRARRLPGGRGYAFVCPTGLSVWRPILPEENDEPGHSPEYRDGRCWATVAVARPGYWS
jgi:hypothetical protein